MKKVKIMLNCTLDIQKFCAIAGGFENDIDLSYGKYTVDAKSILGIFSLDLSQPIGMEIHGDQSDRVLLALKNFIVEESSK